MASAGGAVRPRPPSRPTNRDGSTALLLAAACAKKPLAVLLEATPDANPNARNHAGEGLLNRCAWDPPLLQLVLQRLPDPGVSGRDGGGRPPLHRTVGYTGTLRTARMLLEAGADPNITDTAGRRADDLPRATPSLKALQGTNHARLPSQLTVEPSKKPLGLRRQLGPGHRRPRSRRGHRHATLLGDLREFLPT